jgi:hypothetical protein
MRLRSGCDVMAGVCFIIAAIIGTVPAANYHKDTPITSVSLNSANLAVSNPVWLAGSKHAISCTTSTDDDCNLDTATSEGDSVTHYWTATAGTFKNNDNVGTSVDYLCANSAGGATITVHADDNYAPENNDYKANDDETQAQKAVSVIVPVLDEITYGSEKQPIWDYATDAAVAAPEYSRAASRNNPAAWKVGVDEVNRATTSYWHSTALTESSSVSVFGSVSGGYSWVAASGTFNTWPSAGLQHTRLFGSSTVKVESASITWKFKCPDGTDTYIDMTTHSPNYYFVRKAPVGGLKYNEAAYDKSCDYCQGLTETASDATVCDEVMSGFAGEYTYDGNNCAYMSSDYTHLIGVQGVSANQEQWLVSSDDPPTNGQVTSERTHSIATSGTPPQVYVWGFHWWVTAGGKTRDPSAGVSYNGSWGDYEDVVFADYYRASVGWSVNPAGNSTEQNSTWKMIHANPSVASTRYLGPPTPYP